MRENPIEHDNFIHSEEFDDRPAEQLEHAHPLYQAIAQLEPSVRQSKVAGHQHQAGRVEPVLHQLIGRNAKEPVCVIVADDILMIVDVPARSSWIARMVIDRKVAPHLQIALVVTGIA